MRLYFTFFSALLLCASLFFGAVQAAVQYKELASGETAIIETKNLPKGWAIASDPELVKFGDRWWMFFNSMQLDFKKKLPIHILSASLPKGVPLSAPANAWTVSPYPVISPGPKGSWDERTVETPKYVRGYDATAKQWVQRLYYAGWPVQKNGKKDYHIGFSQWDDSAQKWLKRPDPVMTGDQPWERLNGSSFIGDQSLYYQPGNGAGGADGIWHMWYQAVSNDKKYRGIYLVHVTSRDGINWGSKKIMTHKVPFATKETQTGPFHIDVFVKGGYFYFTGFLYNHKDLSKQGLWITRSRTPDGSGKGDFSEWHPLIFENNGVHWHDAGLESSRCHATGLFSSTLKEENGTFWLFYHGYFRTGKVKKPCLDKSKNSGAIGRAKVKKLF